MRIKFFLFLTIIIFCISCKKQEINVFITTDNILNEVSAPVLEGEKTVQEIVEKYRPITPEVQEIIENYATIAHEFRGRFEFQIEGNFTNSGNREIVAFYGRSGASLNAVFCFVLDTNEEEIEKIYNVNWWGTIDYEYQIEAGSGLTEDLGRYIVWKGDRKIGCTSDFNGNGKDELYLYSLSGMNRQPYFFEFDETEFVKILDIGTVDAAYIDSVDKEKKIIIIREEHTTDDGIFNIDRSSYKWDNDTRRYEFLIAEIKEYLWNINTRQYEEIGIKYYRWNRNTQQYEEIVD